MCKREWKTNTGKANFVTPRRKAVDSPAPRSNAAASTPTKQSPATVVSRMVTGTAGMCSHPVSLITSAPCTPIIRTVGTPSAA